MSLRASWGMAVGALSVSGSAVVIGLSGASPGTASFYRCLFAVPPLAVLAVRERRCGQALSRRGVLFAVVAGVLFAGDMLLWTQAIVEVGAGLSTVLVNLQVVLVPLLAKAVDGEPLSRRYPPATAIALLGVVLASGLLKTGASGRDPVSGTVHAVLAALCYSGFLFLLRRGGRDGGAVRTYAVAIATAGAVSSVAGTFWHGVNLLPGWPVVGWMLLVALSGGVVGWLLVAVCAPRLSSHVGAVLLLLTPVGALALGALVLGERPTALQLAGGALILAAAYAVATPGLRRREYRRTPPGADAAGPPGPDDGGNGHRVNWSRS
ncbi:MAG TPA: DMT family transporter [Streptosporangiales bacterium]